MILKRHHHRLQVPLFSQFLQLTNQETMPHVYTVEEADGDRIMPFQSQVVAVVVNYLFHKSVQR